MTDPSTFYSSRIDRYATQLNGLRRRSTYISIARLVVFLALSGSAYGYYHSHALPWVLTVLAAVALFVLLVCLSLSISDKKKLITQLLFINENETAVLMGSENAFDDGSAITGWSMHAADLDIFGKKSVYHLLNRTATAMGAQSLFRLLNEPVTASETIAAHQQAVIQLSPQADTRQLITARGLLQDLKGASVKDVLLWAATPNRVAHKKWISILRFLFPGVAITGLLLYLSDSNPVLLGLGVIGNWLLVGSLASYTSGQHRLIGEKEPVLKQYSAILATFFTIAEGDSKLLRDLRQTAGEACKETARLSRLSGLLDQRLNLVVNLFLNSLLSYDVHVLTGLENWKRKNSRHVLSWIETVGSIEKINALAGFHFNNPQYVVPAIAEGVPYLHAVELAHPLIPRPVQVANDITIGVEDRLLLISGSNMSGKSTFLRTVGVNVLLAQCGLPVCAKKFSFTPMHILTSIRISDSLQDNTSYFMAELNRLQQIIGLLMTGTPSLVLIDEVLRGTNSADKTYGSEELIRKLSAYNCLCLFASHDLSLGALESVYPGRVKNYCFESIITGGELLFDYKLRSGVATNKNASFLMKKMGIIG